MINTQPDGLGGNQGLKQKIEYFVELKEGAGNGDGDKQRVRAHYFLVSSNGDLIFFIVSPKFGDKKAITAFAAGTWNRVRENWNGGAGLPDKSKSLSHVSFIRDGNHR